MNEEVIERLNARALQYAKTRWIPDPALDFQDLVTMAWLKVLPRLNDAYSEEKWAHYLLMAVASCAIDAQRVMRSRPRGEYGDWLPSPQRVEDEAIANVTLAPIVDRAIAGDRATVALLALALGYQWSDCMAGLGVSRKTVWRWCCARAEVVA